MRAIFLLACLVTKAQLSTDLNAIPQKSLEKPPPTHTKSALKARGPTRSPSNDFHCATGDGFACASCGVSLICSAGKAYMQLCSPGQTTCRSHPDFGDGICYVKPDALCSCRDSTGFLPDPYDAKYFLICRYSSGNPLVVRCPKGKEFDDSSKTCVMRPPLPACSEVGTFPLKGDCNWYYTCYPGYGGGWFQRRYRCSSEQLVYSTLQRRCVLPSSLSKDEPCSVETPRALFKCSLLGYLLSYIFPQIRDKFCVKTAIYK